MTEPDTIEACPTCGSTSRRRRRSLVGTDWRRHACMDLWHARLGPGYQRPREWVERDRRKQ